MKIKLIIFGILITIGLGIMIFFIPKNASSVCQFCPEYPAVQRIENECLGFKYRFNNSFGTDTYCLGLLTRNRICYSSPNNNYKDWVEVPCT